MTVMTTWRKFFRELAGQQREEGGSSLREPLLTSEHRSSLHDEPNVENEGTVVVVTTTTALPANDESSSSSIDPISVRNVRLFWSQSVLSSFVYLLKDNRPEAVGYVNWSLSLRMISLLPMSSVCPHQLSSLSLPSRYY